MRFEMDNFTIVIDISGNKLTSTVLFISKVAKYVKNKIHVINFTEENVKEYFSINENKSAEFIENTKHIVGKLVFADRPVKKIDWVKEYISKLSVEDFVILNGAERLLGYKETTPILKADYLDLQTQVHFLNDENWAVLAHELELIYGEYQNSIQGLITNIFADSTCSEIIQNELEESENMSIIVSDATNRNEDYEILQRELITKLSKMNLSESLKEIELNRSRLGDKTYIYICAMAYYNHGDFSKAIDLLEQNYQDLLNEAKLVLADMLTVTNQRSRAADILNELFIQDKFLKDLFPALLRLYSSSNNYEEHLKWLEIALDFDPDNPAVIELNANRLNKEKKNDLAAFEFRKLRKMLNKPYYELIARINDIIHNDQMSNSDIGNYIHDFVNLNPDLKNEAYYRLAKYFIDFKDSYFMAYDVIKKCSFGPNDPRAVDLIKLRLDILSDDKKASKALRDLKIHKKNSDAIKLNNERANELIRCIDILATEQNGYLFWRKFLDNSQSDAAWKASLSLKLKSMINHLSTLNMEILLGRSWISEINNSDLIYELGDDIREKSSEVIATSIEILRHIKSGDIELSSKFEDINELVKTMNTISEVIGDNVFRLWCRYYLSIIASISGKHQDSNNLALSIFEFYNRVDTELQDLCLYLGMIAWGNSQYRLGRHSEGIACIMASARYIEITNEVYPFLEEGVNLIGRYLLDEVGKINSVDFESWSNFNEQFGSKNLAFKHIWKSIYLEDDGIVEILKDRIENVERIDANWAGDVVNLVGAYAKENDFDSAVKYIIRYHKKAIPALVGRKDIRYRVLHNWAHIVFLKSKTLDDFLIALELIEQADQDIDEKRKVSHKEERASIGTSADEIYRFYIQICSILIGLHDIPEFLRVVMIEKLEKVLPKFSPRSIIEQKDYYCNRMITQEAKELKVKLENAQEEYNGIFAGNSNDTDLLSEKAEIIQSLTEQLKKIHPHYMELKDYPSTKLDDICSFLNDDEIFYQYIITPICVTNIIVSSSSVRIIPTILDIGNTDVTQLGIEFSNLVQSSTVAQFKNRSIDNVSEEISLLVAATLSDYVAKNKVKRIYCMPDFKLGMFPLAAVNIETKFLIDTVDSIINIVDYRVLQKDRNKGIIIKASNRIFGNSNDSELIKIDRWLKKNCSDSLIIIENDSDEIDNLDSTSTIDGVNTIVIYAHGVPDPISSHIDGAKGLEGKKKIIDLSEIIEKVKALDNLFLISCSGGSPAYNNVENSTGTWASIFEMFSGNILSCKWDVPTNQTIELMAEIFAQTTDNCLSIDEALIIAQRKLKDNKNSLNAWAGIEYWIN